MNDSALGSQSPPLGRPAVRTLQQAPAPTKTKGTVLVIDDEPDIRGLVSVALRRAGYDVVQADSGEDALARLAESLPDLAIVDVMMPGISGFELVAQMREEQSTRAIPVIMLTAKGATEDVVTGLGTGADDYMTKPFDLRELIARVNAKVERPPIPSDLLPIDRSTGLLSEHRFWEELRRELVRAQRVNRTGWLAIIELADLPMLHDRLGSRSETELARQVAGIIAAGSSPLEMVGRNGDGSFGLILPETDAESASRRLQSISAAIAGRSFSAGSERLHLTPVIGYAPFASKSTAQQLFDQATTAARAAALHLDLRPVLYAESMGLVRTPTPWAARIQRARERLNLPIQVLATILFSSLVPFLFYAFMDRIGYDITHWFYLVVVAVLLITAYFIWYEAFEAVPPPDVPDEPNTPYPSAAAIIAAYLPNEASTVIETIEAFLRIDYPAPLRIILAYNTPRDMPIEATLQEMARRERRFLPLRIVGSTSKAQNVNAALAEVDGEFIGVFDADHQPQPDSFCRAWRWLSSGYDVVQGHCLIRNGDESWVARLIAVEFESIYAVAHPGRMRMHKFGVFGGSNGYWKTDLLRQTRMRGSMLTEDIDSSLRVIEGGYRIANDPFLISRELGPATLGAVWNQRMRWAQGWFQVSLRHALSSAKSPHLSLHQKLGMFHLLVWRELYPWLSLQMFPILAFWIWRHGLHSIDWFVPLFVLTSVLTLVTGPVQTLFAYLLAAPEVQKHRGWFWFYLVVSFVFYTEFKNSIARIAQFKEAMHERAWKVTPRTTASRET